MNATQQFEPVLTKAYLARQKLNKPSAFEALVFEEPTGMPADAKEEPPRVERAKKHPSSLAGKLGDEFDIKKARHEILNFAMHNQRVVKNQKKMQVFQAIKLGAKAPKKPYKNYKELLDERKRLQNIRDERKKFHQLGKNQTGAASVKCRSKTKLEKAKKKRAPVADIDKHYGVAKSHFKNKKG